MEMMSTISTEEINSSCRTLICSHYIMIAISVSRNLAYMFVVFIHVYYIITLGGIYHQFQLGKLDFIIKMTYFVMCGV